MKDELRHGRWLITGGRGSLGTALREELAACGAVVMAADLPELDITDASKVSAAVDAFKPDCLVNCAALTDVDACELREAEAMRINADAPGFIAGLCRNRGVKFVHISTDYVFDGSSRRPYREDDPVGPESEYGRSKLAGERKVAAADPGTLIVRTAWLYGAGKSFAKAIAARARRGEAVTVVCDQHGAPTSASDLSRAIVELVVREASGVVHFANSGQTTWYDVARMVVKSLGLDVEVKPVTTGEYLASRVTTGVVTAKRPAYSVLDTSQYARMTGAPPRPWQIPFETYLRALPG
ncbi:MAG: dTDP-4-dehydrorhamnose reductase [Myxococcota bacterium]